MGRRAFRSNAGEVLIDTAELGVNGAIAASPLGLANSALQPFGLGSDRLPTIQGNVLKPAWEAAEGGTALVIGAVFDEEFQAAAAQSAHDRYVKPIAEGDYETAATNISSDAGTVAGNLLLAAAGPAAEASILKNAGAAGRTLTRLEASAAERSAPLETLNLFRRDVNSGAFDGLKVPMQLRYVKAAAREGGVGLEGVKVRIIRDPELIGKDIYGYTHPNGNIDLYPDAFTDTEQLVKTLGHERTHKLQVDLYGAPKSTSELNLNEQAAFGLEDSFWKYYLQNKTGRLERFR